MASRDEAVITYSKEVFLHYRDARVGLEDRLVIALKAYRAWDDEYEAYKQMYRENGWRSVLYFPIVYSNIETLAPKMVMTIAADPDFVQLIPTEENDVRFIDGMTVITMKQWEDMNGFDETIGHVKNNLVYGFSFSKYGWVYEEESRTILTPRISLLGMRAGTKETQKKIVIVNRPGLTALPIERIYWDRSISGKMEDSPVLIDRYFASKRFIEDMAGEDGDGWKNTGNINYSDTPALEDEMVHTRKRLHYEEEDEMSRQAITNEWHKKAEILELYGLGPDGKKRWKIVTANRNKVLFDDKNPHVSGRAPLLFTKNSHLPGQVIGSPESEYASPLNRMINMLRNYHIDNVNLGVNGMWVKSRFADIDDNQLISRPWGTVETNDIDGLKPLERPPVTNDALIEARQLEQDIQMGTGVVDFMRGTPPPGAPDTATAVERLSQGANARFAARIKSVQNNLIKEAFKRMIEMDIQYLGPEVAVRIAGKSGIHFSKIRLDNIRGQFDIQVKSIDESIPRVVKQNQLLAMYNLLRGDPEVDQRELKRMLVQQFVPGAEGKLLVPSSDNLTPEEENLVLAGGGLVMPLPNDDHPEHMRVHMQFVQEHDQELEDVMVKIFQAHIKAHTDIMVSVYQPLGPQQATQPPQGMPNLLGSGNGGRAGGLPTGEMGSTADAISAAGGRNATQRTG
jgi:hypothetical protein